MRHLWYMIIAIMLLPGVGLATEWVKVSVRPAGQGGDHATVEAAIDAHKQNLVANDRMIVFYVGGTWEGGGETGPLSFSSADWTTNATHFPIIIGVDSGGFYGSPDTSVATGQHWTLKQASGLAEGLIRIDGVGYIQFHNLAIQHGDDAVAADDWMLDLKDCPNTLFDGCGIWSEADNASPQRGGPSKGAWLRRGGSNDMSNVAFVNCMFQYFNDTVGVPADQAAIFCDSGLTLTGFSDLNNTYNNCDIDVGYASGAADSLDVYHQNGIHKSVDSAAICFFGPNLGSIRGGRISNLVTQAVDADATFTPGTYGDLTNIEYGFNGWQMVDAKDADFRLTGDTTVGFRIGSGGLDLTSTSGTRLAVVRGDCENHSRLLGRNCLGFHELGVGWTKTLSGVLGGDSF